MDMLSERWSTREPGSQSVSAVVASDVDQTVSGAFARDAGLHDLIDTRWATVAHGVGSAHIIGRIHTVLIVVGGLHRVSTFYVIENFRDRVLLGMDFFVCRWGVIRVFAC